MKAYVLHKIGDIRFQEVEMPKLPEDWVLVKVRAAGICGSDIPRIYQTGAHVHPLILGHEFSGEVVETGEKADPYWKKKRVGIFPLIPCRACSPCQKKQYEMCRNYNYLGSRCDGGFAEYAAVPQNSLIELPDSVSFEEAAMLEPMSVAVHAMRRLVEPIEGSLTHKTICICGLGTIGLFLFMFLKEQGCENILAIGNKESQKKQIQNMGLPEQDFCDSREKEITDWIMERTRGEGTELFFECVGKNETVSAGIRAAATAGRIMLVGNPYSDMTLRKQDYWKILRNQLTISGTWNSSFTQEKNDDWHYVLERLRHGRISPKQFISHRFSLAELEQGFHIMRDKTEDYLKIMAVL